MPRISRRTVLRAGVTSGAAGLAGCTDATELLNRESGSDANQNSDNTSCTEFRYESGDTTPEGEYPWDLHIRNISLSDFPVRITVADLSGEDPQSIAYCEATSDEHSELVFDLTDGTSYRVEVTMKDREASATITGPLDDNEALEVTVENGELLLRHVHYDPGKTAT